MVFTGKIRELAKKAVHLDPNTLPPTVDEVLEIMKEQLKPIKEYLRDKEKEA